jgi:manganese/iron transport system permease protein
MFEALKYSFMRYALLACVLGGATCGLIGVFVITMKVPFIGVAMSHAAFAGAIFGILFHLNPVLSGIIFCILCALFIGPIADKAEVNPNVAMGIIFSVGIGLAFLGMGVLPGPKTEALNLFWGSILTITKNDIIMMSAVALVMVMLVLLFFKEIRAVIFHREIAASVGIPEKIIFYSLLLGTGVVVTLSLNTIGGLLIFGLIINPASAAYQLTYSLKWMYILSALLSVVSCLVGLAFSYYFNIPCGAIIIVISSLIFGASLAFSPKRRTLLKSTA